MLSYLHSFHAGNFADVHKHVVLHRVAAHLLNKPAAIAWFDLYAGAGSYDLTDAEARKTAEAERGIGRLWPPQEWPPLLDSYAAALVAANPDGNLRRYPGSPAQLMRLARDADRLVFSELHPREQAHLQVLTAHDARVSLHQRNALEAINGLLPPREKRGVLLLDPSYERKDEYAAVQQALLRLLPHWRHGVYLLWYPLLPSNAHRPMVDALVRQAGVEVLVSELRVPVSGDGMHGSGMLVLNPTWGLDGQLDSLADWFAALGEGRAVLRNRLLPVPSAPESKS